MAIVFIALAVAFAGGAASADEWDQYWNGGPSQSESASRDESDTGPGALFRAGHIEGQGVPQVRPITPLELFPYILSDDSLWFSDLRFFPTNDGTFGGNMGFGYRYYNNDVDRIFGLSGWYDADGTRGVYFQQLGLSLETYGESLDFRANFYLPVGTTEYANYAAAINGTAQFRDDTIVFDQLRSWYAAMKGFDAEAGIPVPGDIAEGIGLRVYGGGYAFVDNDGNSIAGGSARLQANLISGLDAQVQIMHDSFFETRAFVGLSWTFGPIHRSQMSQQTAYGRIGEHVTRNYTVLAPALKEIEQVTAINPETGMAYRVSHVSSSAAAGGTGGLDNPFQTIAAGQAVNRDFVFVHAGSVFNGADANVVLQPGQRIFGDGDGVNHFIRVPQLGTVLAPRGPTTGSRPLLNGATGDGVVLASNSEFAGFTVINAAGSGIVGTDIENVIVRSVRVATPGLDGVRLTGSGGSIRLSDMLVSNVPGNALAIDGGSAAISFAGQIAAGAGRQVTISNTTGGLVELTGASLTGNGGQGILLENNAGDVAFGNVSLANTIGSGIDIQGGTGNFSFAGQTTVSGAGGPAVSIAGLAAAGNVSFNDLGIDHRLGRGLVIDNSAGMVDVTGRLTVSNESGAVGSALAVTNSTGIFSFNRADVTDATGAPGVFLQNNTGLTAFGTLNIASTGSTGLYSLNGGTLHVNPAVGNVVEMARGGKISSVNATALDIQNTVLDVNLTSVSASNAPTGIRLVNTTGGLAIYGDGSVGSGGTITGTTTGLYLQNTGPIGIAWMTLDGNGTGIYAENVEFLRVQNSFVKNSSGYALDALNLTNLVVAESTFTANWAGNIHGRYNALRSYSVNLSGSEMSSGSPDNVVLTMLAGAEGSTLSYSSKEVLFANTLAGTSGLVMNWNGTLSANLDQTVFTGSGGSFTGLLVNNASTTALTTLQMTNGVFAATGGFDTAARVTSAGPAQVTFRGNHVEFGATNGTGFRMALGASSAVSILDNTIIDNTDGATGVLFDSLVGPGSARIEGNIFNLANQGGLLDRGIIFSSIDTTTGKIQLLGSQNNQITGADTPFLAPFGSTSGSILVNGVPVP